MKKIVRLDDYFPTGEQTVQPVLLWGPGRSQIDYSHITKTASEALDFIKNVTPEPGKTHLLVLALGSEEAYGPNRNGDGFPERPVPAKHGKGWWIAPGQELTKHYQSFETNPAHAFKHHQNKDPKTASGYVKKAFWNPKMHRVELLIILDNAKDPEWIQRVNDGDFCPVSMGCKIKFDVCSRCGNKAPTRTDYCFPPGTKITMADGTRRPIEDIRVGDWVLDATGHPTRVTALSQRNVDECLVEFRSSISDAVLRPTQNHPVFSSPREAYTCYYRATQPEVRSCFPGTLEQCNACCRLEPDARETPAGTLRINDSVYAPAVLGANTTTLSKELAYAIGLFMAEGSYAKQNGKRVSVQFSRHEDETELIGVVERLAIQFQHEAKTYSRDSSKGVSVRIHSREVAELMFHYCGEYAHTKKASQEIVDLPDALLREYLQGLWDGDGHISTTKANYSRLNTASEDLAWQTAGLLRRLGYASYVGTAMVPGGPSNRTNKFPQWYVATDYRCSQRRTATAFTGTRQIGHIKEVRHVPYRGPVHNFETTAHTYVAEGIAVHNCDHVKFEMNKVNSDGTKNYVHNPDPSFFDISRVFRPADRTGYTLKKVAHVYELQSSASLGEIADDLDRKAAAVKKLCAINKVLCGTPIASASSLKPEEEQVIRNFAKHSQAKLGHAPALPMDELLRWTPKVAFSTVTSLGMKLSAAEFLDYMTSQLAGRPTKLAEDLIDRIVTAQPIILQTFAEVPALLDEVLKTGALDESPEHVSNELREKLAVYAVKRAQFGELLYRRLVPEGVGMRPDGAPRTDLLTYADPTTGQTYRTTRGAAIDARDAQTHADLGKLLGGSALMLGGYKLLTLHPSLRPWKVPLALGTGALGYHTLKPGGRPQYTTDQGINIPAMTEFAPMNKGASENLTGVVVGLIEDYLRPGVKTASTKSIDAAVEDLIRQASVDDIRGLELDLDDVASAVGHLICQ